MSWARYGIALSAIGAALVVRWLLTPVLGNSHAYLMLFGGIALAVWFGRWKPAAVAAIVGFLVANYFWASPHNAFQFNSFFAVEFAGYALSAGFILFFVERMHRAHTRDLNQKNLLSVTLASIGDGVIATDPQGYCTFLNDEAARLTGWQLGEAIGQTLPEVFRIINERTRQPAENPVEKVLRSGKVVGLANHTVLLARNGTEKPIDDSAAPIRQADGSLSGVVLVFRDATEQRTAWKSKARLATIVEHSTDAVLTKNIGGIIQTWNAGAERLFGYKADEIVGGPVTTLFPADRLSEENHILGLLRQGEICAPFETVRISKNGEPIHVSVGVSPLKDEDGVVVGASTIIRDIRELVAAREGLVREKQLLATTLVSIGDGVIVTDAQGRITLLNGEAERLTGWKNSDAASRPLPEVFRIVNEESRQTVENPVEKVLRLGGVVGLANHTILVAKDGSEMPIDDSGAPIKDANGTTRGVVLVFRDFTEHKEAARKLKEAKEEAEKANKAKDQFLAMLSHELRTPLTPVLATLNLWETSEELPRSMRSDVQMMRRSVELEARIIDDLLDLTRIARGLLSFSEEDTDVHELIHFLVGMCRSEFRGKDLTLAMRLDAERHHVRADAGRLQQVFWNIIKNAAKFTENGGTITISSSNDDRENIDISVADTGIGMAPETLSRLFTPFEQGEQGVGRRYGGLGLGMAISSALVELMGGAIAAKSEGPGKGSTFTVTFPALQEGAAGAKPAAEFPQRADGGLKILLVEDHADTARALVRLLARRGYDVRVAGTMAAALSAVERGKFDLLICDIGLPDGTGLDLIQEVRKTYNTPALALSGFGMDEDISRAKAAGFGAHLPKPVNLQQLEAAIWQLTSDPK